MIVRAAAALAMASLIALGVTLARYESARDAWRPTAHVGEPGYDAAASDAAYAAVESALVWVDRAARASAVLVVALGVAIGRAQTKRARPETTRGRRIAARGIDLATLVLAIGLAQIRLASPAWTIVVDWVGASVVIAIAIGVAITGATIGDRALTRPLPRSGKGA